VLKKKIEVLSNERDALLERNNHLEGELALLRNMFLELGLPYPEHTRDPRLLQVKVKVLEQMKKEPKSTLSDNTFAILHHSVAMDIESLRIQGVCVESLVPGFEFIEQTCPAPLTVPEEAQDTPIFIDPDITEHDPIRTSNTYTPSGSHESTDTSTDSGGGSSDSD
jgi:hypothetical protein